MNTSTIELNTENEESKHQRKKIIFTKLRIIKNLIIAAVGSFLSFCAYDGLTILQSTINRQNGIGVISVSIQYGFGCISALLFTKYFIKKFGCKSVISMTSFSYVIYIGVNFYPTWYLMIPASVIAGLASSLFWSAQCAYLNDLSILYSDHLLLCKNEGSLEDKDCIKGHYSIEKECTQSENRVDNTQYDTFHINNDFHSEKDCRLTKYETSEIHTSDYNREEPHTKTPGEENGISIHSSNSTSNIKSLDDSTFGGQFAGRHTVPCIMTVNSKSKTLESKTARMFGFHGLIFQTCHIWSSLLNYYVLRSESINIDYINNSTCMCGAGFCNFETDCFVHNLQEPADDKKYTLLGTFVGLSMISVFIATFFLDELKNKDKEVFITLEVLLASFRHLKDKFQILLIPLTAQVGVAVGFFMGDYTKAYIGCAWGIEHIGLVTVCWGATLAVSCTLSGWFVKHLGRTPIFLIGEIAILVAVSLMFIVYPNAERPSTFFIISGLFGVNTGIFWSQLRAFYGILFKENEEAAFGNYQIFHSLGGCIAFGYSNFVCTTVKIYILLGFSIVGFIGYILAERGYSQKLSRT